MLQVLKNGIYFTLDGSTWAFRCVVESRDLRSLSSDFEQVQSEYNKAQERLLSAIVEVARSYVPLFHLFASLVAQLDVLLAFAEAAAVAPIPYVRPEMLEGSEERCGRWERVGCRYPCGGGTPCAAGLSVIRRKTPEIQMERSSRTIHPQNAESPRLKAGGFDHVSRGLYSVTVFRYVFGSPFRIKPT